MPKHNTSSSECNKRRKSSSQSTIVDEQSCSVEETHENLKQRTDKCVRSIKHIHQDFIETTHVRPVIYKTNKVHKITKYYKPKVKETWEHSDEKKVFTANKKSKNDHSSSYETASDSCSNVDVFEKRKKSVKTVKARNDSDEISIRRHSDSENKAAKKYDVWSRKNYKSKNDKKCSTNKCGNNVKNLWLDVSKH